MACCVIAAFILAQFVATLRRWGVFWGLVEPEGDEAANTLSAKLRAFFFSDRGRRVVRGVVALEFVALSAWLTVFHGEHLYELADIGLSRLEGKHVIYAGLCQPDGAATRTRIVLEDLGS